MTTNKTHKPYLTGDERGKFYSIVADMKPNECIDVSSDEIGRARSAMNEVYPLGTSCIRKLQDGTYRLWRLDLSTRQRDTREKNAYARQFE
tara:strand:- start:116 stop:388 length:273 start_codon:yes stop_codon:yes gene_type:complete